MRDRWIVYGTVALGFALTASVGSLVTRPHGDRSPEIVDDVGARARQPPSRIRSGTELIAVLVVASTCGGSSHRELPAAIANIHKSLEARATARGQRFVSIGVALDETAPIGLEFLKRFGTFDEVLAGGSWFGMGAVAFFLRGPVKPLATPQLVLLKREVRAEGTIIEVSTDSVLLLKSGGPAIVQYAAELNQGASGRLY